MSAQRRFNIVVRAFNRSLRRNHLIATTDFTRKRLRTVQARGRKKKKRNYRASLPLLYRPLNFQ